MMLKRTHAHRFSNSLLPSGSSNGVSSKTAHATSTEATTPQTRGVEETGACGAHCLRPSAFMLSTASALEHNCSSATIQSSISLSPV